MYLCIGLGKYYRVSVNSALQELQGLQGKEIVLVIIQ